MNDIILSGNSPGELWGWIRPLAAALRRRVPGARLSLYLFPCPYATGKEADLARKDLEIPFVYPPAQSLKTIAFGNGNPRAKHAARPVLIHLGGDILYASLLARRLKARAYAYQWGQRLWDASMAGYFVADTRQKDLLTRRGIPGEKIAVTGDLMVDAVGLDALEARRLPDRLAGEALVTFFPGSRGIEIRHMLPYYLRVAELVREKLPGVRFALAVSPFVSMDDVARALRPRKFVLESSSGTLLEEEDETWIETQRGMRVLLRQGSPYQLMKRSDCIVTIPGTKSGEAGFLNVPMIVVLPTNKLEVIPYPGILDFLGRIPAAGPLLKRTVGFRFLKRMPFLAQPNLLAGEKIVPEIVERLTAASTAVPLLNLLRDETRRRNIASRLKDLYKNRVPGAESLIHHITCGRAGEPA